MRAKAFSPGHITGFFEICRKEDLLSTGSRGAGMCLTLGATSDVEIVDSDRQDFKLFIDGKRSEAEVTRGVLRHLIGEDKKRVEVRTALQLPQSQGFGMSAAGALSAALATADILGLERQRAFEAAHMAEIECGCGLGDVSAIHRGGITIRDKPGLPPIGKVHRLDGSPDMVLAVVGELLLTKSVLSDPVKARAINAHGSKRVDELLRTPTLERLMTLSLSFCMESGLASDEVVDAIEAASGHGMASMSMLGNSVFAVGKTDQLKEALSEFGQVFTCKVDTQGPSML